MISSGVKVALAAAAAATAVGIGIAVAKSGSAAAAPPQGTTPGVPPQGAQVWIRATTILPGQTVRLSVPPSALTALGITAALPDFENVLAAPTVVQLLATQNVNTWGPGDANLPADWPPDDTAAATEFHAQFVYGEVPPAPGAPALPALSLSQLPLAGALAWVPKGTGAGA